MRRVEALDYARLTAASTVVAFHFLFKGIQEGKTPSLAFIPGVSDIARYGYLGVQLFFIISGYVIFFSAKSKTAGEFAASRTLRLYPAFWVAVLFTSASCFFLGGDAFQVSGPQVLANLTMVPGPLGYPLIDGVYWTLAYELKFYILVGALIFVGLCPYLEVFFIAWPALMAFSLATGHEDLTYCGGFYAFFAAGALFAMLQERVTWPRLVSLAASLLLCIDATLKQGARMSSEQSISYAPIVLATVIVVLFVFFATLQIPRMHAVSLPYSRLVGGLTYPLYLTHSVLGFILLSWLTTRTNAPLAYAAVTILSLLVAYLIHTIVEQRWASGSRRVFDRLVRQPVDGAHDYLFSRLPTARLT